MINRRDMIVRSFLMIFELIRCRSLCFEGVNPSIAAEVVKLSTCDSPIQDLPQQGLRLWNRYKRVALLIEDYPNQYRFPSMSERLGNAARRYLPHDFELAKLELTERTEELMTIARGRGLIVDEDMMDSSSDDDCDCEYDDD